MPLLLIFIVLVLQLLGYIFLDRYGYPNWKVAVLLFVIVLHLYVLPAIVTAYLFPEPTTCGLPVMAVVLGFWVIGGGLTLFAHGVYYLVRRRL